MNTLEIAAAMTAKPAMGDQFLGVFARDQLIDLKKIERFPAALIVNTDKSTDRGQHWVAVYCDAYQTGEYFDSYGREPFEEIMTLFKKQ